MNYILKKLQITQQLMILSLISLLSSDFIASTQNYQQEQRKNVYEDQFLNQDFAISSVTQIINNTQSPLIITSPDLKHGDIFITKNISLLDGIESLPLRPDEYQHAIIVKPKMKSFITNFKIPSSGVSIDGIFDRKLSSNNYDSSTMSAICLHVPPQKFQLNYSIVHKPLPVIAVRQKGNLLDVLEGDGLNSVYLNNQQILAPLFSSFTPFVEKIENNATYTIEVNQVKPIGHFENVRHDNDDLSTMYLDGGAWVTPLNLNPNTLNIMIKRNNISQSDVVFDNMYIRPHLSIQSFGVNIDGIAQAVIVLENVVREKDLQKINNFFDTHDFMVKFSHRARQELQPNDLGRFYRYYLFAIDVSQSEFQKIIDEANNLFS